MDLKKIRIKNINPHVPLVNGDEVYPVRKIPFALLNVKYITG
jgi:hypothetical protein